MRAKREIKRLQKDMQAFPAQDIKRNVGPKYKEYRAKYDQAEKLRQQVGKERLVKRQGLFPKMKGWFVGKKTQFKAAPKVSAERIKGVQQSQKRVRELTTRGRRELDAWQEKQDKILERYGWKKKKRK